MKSNTAKAALAVAAALSATSLAACGNAGSSASASGGDTVTLGAILPLTGQFSVYGGPLRDAVQMGMDEVNKNGGVKVGGKTYKFALKSYDDATTPDKSVPQIFPQAVLRDKVAVLLTAWNSQQVAPFLKSNPIPVIDILAASDNPAVNTLDKNIFLTRPIMPEMVPGTNTYLSQKFGVKKIAYIGPDDDFSNSKLNSLEGAMPAYGQSMTVTVKYPPDATDLSSFIRKAIDSHPDAIVTGGSTQAAAPVLSQLHELGWTKPIGMTTGMTPDQAKDLIGKDVYNDVMKNVYEFEGVTPQSNPLPAAQQFGKDFEARFHTYGIDLVQWAYDAPFIVKAAMEKAKTVNDREAIRDAMTKITVPDGTVTGWVPRDGGLLFDSTRHATSLSVGLAWNTKTATWDPAIYYTVDIPTLKVNVVDPKQFVAQFQ